MDAKEFTSALVQLLYDAIDEQTIEFDGDHQTFTEAGMLTNDEGFIFQLTNGEKFVVVVKQC
jgi:hypothetical protein